MTGCGRAFADLLTIIVPRHPERGPEIVMLCGTRRTLRRATGALPDAGTAIYVADTMGELGLFYRLAPFAFIGGSLIPHGGQNPLEAARLGCAVLAGPHTANFADAYEAIFAAQDEGLVGSSTEIAALAELLLERSRRGPPHGRGRAPAAPIRWAAPSRRRGPPSKLC